MGTGSLSPKGVWFLVSAFFFRQRSANCESRSDVSKFSAAAAGPTGTNKRTVLTLLLTGMIMVTVVLVAHWAGAVGVAALGPILRQTRMLVRAVLTQAPEAAARR